VRSFATDTDEIQEVNVRVCRIDRPSWRQPRQMRPQSHETATTACVRGGVVLMYGTIDDHYYEDPYLHDSACSSVAACAASRRRKPTAHERINNCAISRSCWKSGIGSRFGSNTTAGTRRIR